MTPLLEARGLTKTYSADGTDVRAVRGIDLDVAPGEFVAVMGPSGCGKSTLLHLLGGLDRPTAGSVALAGRRVERLSEAEWAILRRAELGYVFQFFNLVATLTVAENLELPSRLVGVSRAAARARGLELLERLGVADRADMLPARLSGGEQQRVALARALVNRPSLVLADEPTGNLDTESAREVMALLRELRDGEQSLVLVTHDARVASAADRVLTMRDGLVVDDTSLTRSGSAATEDVLTQLIRLESL